LEKLDAAEKSLKGVKYSVFGCGNREWVGTYQRIPTLVDDAIEKNGGQRLLERGTADASSVSFFSAFQEYESKLWESLQKVRPQQLEIIQLTFSEGIWNSPQIIDLRGRYFQRRSCESWNRASKVAATT